jgi:hypothetical protein
MPNISSFYGINIFMQPKEHSPPHFHARYGDYAASFDMKGTLKKGKFPARKRILIKAWASLHEEELLANWQLLELGLTPVKIEPLR